MSTLDPQRPIAALVACACLIAGCASTGKAGTADDNVVEATTEIAGDPLVECELEILRPRVDESGRTKTLEFDLRNRSSMQQSFAYAIAWSDRSDKRVGAPQRSWTLLTLDSGASVSLMIPFPADGAESWRLLAVRPEEVR